MSTSDKALPVHVGIQMGLQKRFHSIVQYTRRAAPAVLYCLGRAHEMMSRLAQTLSNKVISNYLHSAFVCRFFSCSQALQPTNNHGRSTQQQQQLRDHYNYTLVRFDKIFCLFFLEDKQFVKKTKTNQDVTSVSYLILFDV